MNIRYFWINRFKTQGGMTIIGFLYFFCSPLAFQKFYSIGFWHIKNNLGKIKTLTEASGSFFQYYAAIYKKSWKENTFRGLWQIFLGLLSTI